MAMSNNSTRHFVAFTITLVAVVSFIAGYLSAEYGWWWTAFAALIVYGGVFKALK
jgi:CHASE2 domain-containing sensor protein